MFLTGNRAEVGRRFALPVQTEYSRSLVLCEVKQVSMRFSTIRTGIVATAAAVALAACGGHGLVPSQSAATGDSQSNFNRAPDAPVTCSTVPNAWEFHGACTAAKLTAKGATVALAKYMDITFKAVIGKNNAKGTVAFLLGDAIDNGDITGKIGGRKFPPYAGKNCLSEFGKPTTCLGKVFMYVEVVNRGKAKVVLPDSPAITIVDTKGFPGKNECFPAFYHPTKPLGWEPQVHIEGKPGATTLHLPSVPVSGGFTFFPGPVYIAMFCE
jgi:hypothetical protein